MKNYTEWHRNRPNSCLFEPVHVGLRRPTGVGDHPACPFGAVLTTGVGDHPACPLGAVLTTGVGGHPACPFGAFWTTGVGATRHVPSVPFVRLILVLSIRYFPLFSVIFRYCCRDFPLLLPLFSIICI